MKHVFILFVRLYQKTLSPDHGWFRGLHPHGFCRFYPSCSEYAVEAIDRFGSVKGIWLAMRRLGRCHPFNPPKIDKVPER